MTSLAAKGQTQKVKFRRKIQWDALCQIFGRRELFGKREDWLSTPCQIYFQHGATKTSELVDLGEFFQNHILPELQTDNGMYSTPLQLQTKVLLPKIAATWLFQSELAFSPCSEREASVESRRAQVHRCVQKSGLCPFICFILLLRGDQSSFFWIGGRLQTEKHSTHSFQLSKEILVAVVPLLIKMLTASSAVVHSYAASALEKIFMIKSPTGGSL